MHTQRINITLPNDLARELRKTIPARSRSKYISEAVKEKMIKTKNLKKELILSLKANRKLYVAVQEDFKYVDAEAFEKLP